MPPAQIPETYRDVETFCVHLCAALCMLLHGWRCKYLLFQGVPSRCQREGGAVAD